MAESSNDVDFVKENFIMEETAFMFWDGEYQVLNLRLEMKFRLFDIPHCKKRLWGFEKEFEAGNNADMVDAFEVPPENGERVESINGDANFEITPEAVRVPYFIMHGNSGRILSVNTDSP